jgi:hypothetical protein
MKTLTYKLRNKFWSYWYDKGYSYYGVLKIAYITDMVLSNVATAIVTATVVTYLVTR